MTTPRPSRRTVVLSLLASLAVAWPAAAREIQGRVVGITDGDTLILLTDQHEQVRIRLAGIDAPESTQPFGEQARQMLARLAFERHAAITVLGTDRYGRQIGQVFVEGHDINAEMVYRGGAWVFRRYSSDPALLHLEAEAREARRGLWALPDSQRLAPWEWREARQHNR